MPRPRLPDLLETNPDRAFTLVSAPAGYGKSSLASGWLDGAGAKSAWLSLDEEDKNPRDFLKYLVAAVRTHSPKACRRTPDIQVIVNPAQNPGADVIGVFGLRARVTF